MEKKYWVVNKIDSNIAEILIYGDIYPYADCVTAKGFATELKELEKTCSKIHVRINSNGGSVFEGIAIFNAIKNSSCEIHTYIDGIAASMGSVIAMAGKKVFMSKYARLMTHKPSGGAFGSSDDLRQMANEIDDCEKILNAIYVSKTGLTVQEVSQKFLNGKDMYFSAEEAKRERLIDGIYDGEPVELPDNTKDTNKIWSAYNAKLQNRTISQPPLEDCVIIGESGCIIEVKNGAYIVHDRLGVVSTSPQPTAAKKVDFPDEMFKGWDELLESNKLDKIEKENYTLYAAIYGFAFGKEIGQELRKDKMNPALYEVYYDELVRRRIDYIMSLSVDELFNMGLFDELKRLSEDGHRKKMEEYAKQYED